jgi:hypothetical protein
LRVGPVAVGGIALGSSAVSFPGPQGGAAIGQPEQAPTATPAPSLAPGGSSVLPRVVVAVGVAVVVVVVVPPQAGQLCPLSPRHP